MGAGALSLKPKAQIARQGGEQDWRMEEEGREENSSNMTSTGHGKERKAKMPPHEYTDGGVSCPFCPFL